VRVIVLTTFEADEYILEALRSGASGFLGKSVEPEELLDAIRVVARGDALLSPRATRSLIARFLTQPRDGAPDLRADSLAVLTDREVEVLRLLAAGLTNAEIAERLWVGHSTVKTHVTRLLTKLELRDRAQAVVYAYETGLVQPGAAG